MTPERLQCPDHVGLAGRCKDLAFTLRKMENHWRVLSTGVAKSDLDFNSITPATILRID